MFDRNSRLNFSGLLLFTALIAGCSGGSGVSTQSSESGAASQPSPVAAAPAASPATASASSPAAGSSPTPNPILKQASGQPGVPVPVPESLKRPMTPEEMQKAMQALPPEVRKRIMGLGQAPQPSPAPAKK
ncbi:MAG: hypothetical protein ACREEM_06825 [Blastocatellia bacterium]